MHEFKFKSREIQTTITIVFTLISVGIMLLFGGLMYFQFSKMAMDNTVDSMKTVLVQTDEELETYLTNMRRVSDAAYYNVIKEGNIREQKQDIQMQINLLYEVNKEDLRSIALYNDYGSLLMAEPVANQAEDPNVTKQDWFIQAKSKIENLHFSTPHIQNLFDDGSKSFDWVISLSRVVEINNGEESEIGVLLVDMDYTTVASILKQINRARGDQYYYLCDESGRLIYHPKQIQISNGISGENSEKIAKCKDGIYEDFFQGEHRKVVVDTISYTGWKLVGVIPYSTFTSRMINLRYFIVLLFIVMIMMLLLVNRLVSNRISRPIRMLNESVSSYEAGEKPQIYIGGSQEIRHLSNSIQRSYEQIDELMNEIVLEQNQRRKSELDALQSQINPHFLYNTLDSIMWMVEGERNDEASFMISQLAKLFRVSLSKGHTVISIRDELQHARSYMNIQKVRYKDAFEVEFDVDEELQDYCTAKLILQPLLENSINYGIDQMDDCGHISVHVKKVGDEIWLSVKDNGVGMTEEEVDGALLEEKSINKHGSGIGLVNVNNRVQILFGKQYGIFIESELDEGTEVFIKIPAIAFTPENQKSLELGDKRKGGANEE